MKALFLDLDGTLLNDDRAIPDGNRKALDEMLEKDHKVIINTGRPLAGAIGLAKELELDRSGCYLAAFNGGLVYEMETKDIIYRSGMTPEAVRIVSEEAKKANVHVQMYDDWKVLCEEYWVDEYLDWYCNRLGMEYRILAPEELADIRPLKMSGIDLEDKQRLAAFGERLKEAAPKLVDAFLSSDKLLEIVAFGQNKGSALKWVSERIGISEENTIAIGDEANDIPMLREARLGVAMINGTPETRAAADLITTRDNNNCGVAEIIENYILN